MEFWILKYKEIIKIFYMIIKLKFLYSFVMNFNVKIVVIILINKRYGCFYVFENEFKSCNNVF